MTIPEIMRLADAYANEACRGNEYDNRDKTGAARRALLDALKKALKR